MCGTCGAHAGHGSPVADCARVVVVGKGGVGKSTVTALLARRVARGGRPVLAIDADEQCNLGLTIGFDPAALATVVPVSRADDYIEEKTGARPGSGAGGLLRLNPDTDDIVDRLAIAGPDGIRLLVMGGVQRAGGGCLCPENALLAAAIAGMRARDDEVVVMDTHAGVEHFGRSLARGFDVAVVIVEPTFNSVQVGLATARLASELGIGGTHLAVNSVRHSRDLDRVTTYLDQLGGFTFASVHTIPYDERVRDAEPSVEPLIDASEFGDAVGHLAEHLLGRGVAVRTGAGSCA